MSIIGTIIMGFLVGLFARALMPGRDITDFIMTTLLGIGGAIVGRFIGELMGIYAQGEQAGFIMSLVGAMILLYIYNHFRKTSIP